MWRRDVCKSWLILRIPVCIDEVHLDYVLDVAAAFFRILCFCPTRALRVDLAVSYSLPGMRRVTRAMWKRMVESKSPAGKLRSKTTACRYVRILINLKKTTTTKKKKKMCAFVKLKLQHCIACDRHAYLPVYLHNSRI